MPINNTGASNQVRHHFDDQNGPESSRSDPQNQSSHLEGSDSQMNPNPHAESDRNAALASLGSAHSERESAGQYQNSEGHHSANESYGDSSQSVHLRGGLGRPDSSSRRRERSYENWPELQVRPGQVQGYDETRVTSRRARFVEAARTRLDPNGPPLFNPSGRYRNSVERDLNTINQPNADPRLISEMHGSTQPVVMTHPSVDMSRRARREHISANRTESAGDSRFYAVYGQSGQQQLATFQAAYQEAQRAGYTDQDIAQEINTASQATNASLGRHSRLEDPISAGQISNWIQGTEPLPDRDSIEFSYLTHALQRFLPPGAGSASRISYDPWNRYGGGGHSRPSVVGLHHEMVHAHHNATGTRVFSDDDPENEMMAIGYRPFDQIPLGGGPRTHTENEFRARTNLPPRTEG